MFIYIELYFEQFYNATGITIQHHAHGHIKHKCQVV